MTKLYFALLAIVAGGWGCSTGSASRGGTLLLGINQYEGAMQYSGSAATRWPERQQAAGELKTVITATVGASDEFYRLVDLDLRKREFAIAMREMTVPANRQQEMREELGKMDEEVAALKPVIKTQLAAVSHHEQAEGIDGIATLGLLGIAVDRFAGPAKTPGLESPSTKVGQYVVTGLGGLATVRAPDGSAFRCEVFGSLDQGGGVRCEQNRHSTTKNTE